VRLIGVDTPESKHPRKPVQAFGKEASAFTKQLVEGKDVRLEFDVQRKDKYQRTLAYVYVGDTMLNAELVRQGYAQVATFPPNVTYQELFLKLQREAREAGRGLWKAK
jgi:micrococcal nuclease